jgi:hypothetical protein
MLRRQTPNEPLEIREPASLSAVMVLLTFRYLGSMPQEQALPLSEDGGGNLLLAA